jgi:energy-coupling factor transporter ATP-binding protein EcfA2
MRALFPKFEIWISFRPNRDVFIDVSISTTGPSGRRCPVELVGTGVLQALQIFSYVTLFAPSILLLDEPDAHLHPDNQALLANALQYITSETRTHVLMSTHSRHMVDALHQDANFVSLKDGKVSRQGVNLDRLPFLLDIGALDSFDRLMAGQTKWVFLTEDSDASMLETLAEIAGFPRKDTLFFSYKTSSNLEPAKILAEFILEISPQTLVIIHRDRDFMTTDEVEKVCARIAKSGAVPFITEPSDVEGYFIAPGHIAAVTEKAPTDVVAWLDGIAAAEHTQLQHEFTRKRDAVKSLLYRKDVDKCPDTLTLIGNTIPLAPDKRRGKFMLKKVRGGFVDFIGKDVDLLVPSAFIKSPMLDSIRKSKA